jgi:MraZ protein
MPDFSNQYNATIDDKGRVVLPAAFKKEMGDTLERIFAIELDPYEKCLNLYPLSSWEKRLAFVRSRLNPNDPRQSKVLDRFYQSFVKVEMSDNGRLNIPNLYFEKKGISKDVMFTGQGERIRLWDAEEFRKAMLPDDDYTSMFKEFMGGPMGGF